MGFSFEEAKVAIAGIIVPAMAEINDKNNKIPVNASTVCL
jgi:hypothetical protein